MKEEKTIDEFRLQECRDQYRRSIDRQRHQNETRRAMKERQKEADQHNLSVYKRQRDYHQQQARQYKALLKNERLGLERAKERYNEVKRESYSDTKRHRRRLDLYKNRVENTETTTEMYRNKIEHHEGQAEDYQDKIDLI